MTKLITIAVLLAFPLFAKAELMGFGDGTIFDPAKSVSEPEYLCFMNGECLGKDGSVTTREALGLAPIQAISVKESAPVVVSVPNFDLLSVQPAPKMEDILSGNQFSFDLQKDSAVFVVHVYPETSVSFRFDDVVVAPTRTEFGLATAGQKIYYFSFDDLESSSTHTYSLSASDWRGSGERSGSITTKAQ